MTELRPYQARAVEAFLARGKGTIKAVTGTGKTIIAIAAARSLSLREETPAIRTLVITPTIDLVRQWFAFFIDAGFDPREYEVVTYALAARRVEDPSFWEGYDFIVADEMHHLAEGAEWMRILLRIYDAPFALGLSATPPTDPENAALRVLPVVFEYTLEEARDEGYAAPVEVRPVGVQLTEEERAEYRGLTDLIRVAVQRAGSVGRAAKMVARTVTDPETGQAVNVYGGQLMTARKQLVALAENKFAKLEELVGGILGLTRQVPDGDAPSRIFVWSEYIDALERAKEVLNRNGPIAELVTGATPKKERRRLLTEAWGRDFPVLLVAKVGEEGIDAPEASVGIILAGARTSRQSVQRVGRLLRPLPNKIARLYLIYAERTLEERLVEMMDAVT